MLFSSSLTKYLGLRFASIGARIHKKTLLSISAGKLCPSKTYIHAIASPHALHIIWMQASIGHMGCIGTLLLWCIGTVSKTVEISKSTLQCYVANAKKKGLDDMNFKPNYKSNLVFDEIEEWQLQVYLLTASKHHDGLTTTETRKLAVLSFSFLGSDWFYGMSSMPFCQETRSNKSEQSYQFQPEKFW